MKREMHPIFDWRILIVGAIGFYFWKKIKDGQRVMDPNKIVVAGVRA